MGAIGEDNYPHSGTSVEVREEGIGDLRRAMVNGVPTWYVRFFMTTPKHKPGSASSGNSHTHRALQMICEHSVMSITPAGFLSVCKV